MNYFVDFYGGLRFGVIALVVNNLIAAFVPLLAEDIHIRRPKDVAVLAAKIAVAVIVMNCLCALSYVIFADKYMSQLCGGILTALWLIFVCKYRATARVAIGVSYFAVICVALVCCFSMLDLISTLGIEMGEMEWIMVTLVVIIIGACVAFFKVFSLSRLEETVLASLGIVCVAAAACVVFWVITNFFDVNSAANVVISIILLVILLTAYYSVFAISRAVCESNRRRADSLLRETDATTMRISAANIEAMRRLRHELRNQYTMMKLMLERGEYEKLNDYFSEYSERLLPSLSYVDCGNRVVSAVMNVELDKAARSGIKIDYEIAVPAETAFADTDMCSLLFNLLNNAIEHLERNPEVEDRTVVFRLKLINKTLFVTVENAVASEHERRSLTLITSKKDKAAHGYGTKVVKGIVDAHNGSVEYKAEHGRFVVSAILSEPTGGGLNNMQSGAGGTEDIWNR